MIIKHEIWYECPLNTNVANQDLGHSITMSLYCSKASSQFYSTKGNVVESLGSVNRRLTP